MIVTVGPIANIAGCVIAVSIGSIITVYGSITVLERGIIDISLLASFRHFALRWLWWYMWGLGVLRWTSVIVSSWHGL